MTHCIVTGLEFASSREMEEAYGLDSPESLRAESQANFEDNCINQQDAMEANSGPVSFHYSFDEIPF